MKLRTKILMLVLVPLILLGGTVFTISSIEITSSMKERIEKNLEGIAIATEGNITQGVTVRLEGNTLYSGSKNISDDTSVLDDVKKATNVDVTIFYGDTRYATTVVKDGKRVVGTKASEAVVNKVIKGGQSYFAENVDVEGEKFFAFYVPITNPGSNEAVGMVFAGIPMTEMHSVINSILVKIGITSGVLFVFCTVIAAYVAISLVKKLQYGVKALEKVADGDLTVKIPSAWCKAKDETGDLYRAIIKLKKSLAKIVGDIISKSQTVNMSSVELDEKAGQTNRTVEQVESAVTDIAQGATSQADETQRAMENVVDMGNMVAETHTEVERLTHNANDMQKMGQQAADTLIELKAINEKTRSAIDIISEQTNTTNESATKIRQATSLIASIAEETNLLSLNASIEAARAGEQGRGFAVVAGQIQKLAEQSNASTKQIEEIIDALIKESDKSVETMEDVRLIIEEQNNKVEQTDAIFKKVMKGIEESIEGVNSIAERTSKIDAARVNVVDVVQSLTAIAEENAAGAQETSASVTEVTNIVGGVAQSATELKNIATGLQESISIFTVDENEDLEETE